MVDAYDPAKTAQQCDINKVAKITKEFAESKGLMLVKKLGENEYLSHIPIIMFPTLFPRQHFESALQLQTIYNLLYYKVSQDSDFLYDALKNVIKVDSFVRNLWEIYDIVKKEKRKQKIELCVNRSDYMLHLPKPILCPEQKLFFEQNENSNKTNSIDVDETECLEFKQVEFNTISVGMISTSKYLAPFHRNLLKEINSNESVECLDKTDVLIDNCIPLSESLRCVASGLLEALRLYHISNNCPSQPSSRNHGDSRTNRITPSYGCRRYGADNIDAKVNEGFGVGKIDNDLCMDRRTNRIAPLYGCRRCGADKIDPEENGGGCAEKIDKDLSMDSRTNRNSHIYDNIDPEEDDRRSVGIIDNDLSMDLRGYNFSSCPHIDSTTLDNRFSVNLNDKSSFLKESLDFVSNNHTGNNSISLRNLDKSSRFKESLGLVSENHIGPSISLNNFGRKLNFFKEDYIEHLKDVFDQNDEHGNDFGENGSGRNTSGLCSSCKKAAILFLVYNEEPNLLDQKALEREMLKLDENLIILRRCLTNMADNMMVDIDDKLTIDGYEVGVVYFRSGYKPEDYSTAEHWHCRLAMERSRAITCPSIGMHLAGTKKVQEALTSEKALQKFLNQKDADKLMKTFARIYSLENMPRTFLEHLKDDEDCCCDDFVLKPQKEGGGNNLFGRDISTTLKTLNADPTQASKYILMEKLNPPHARNIFVHPEDPPKDEDLNSELGVFGVLIGYGDTIKMNCGAGYLLRSKSRSTNEGGLMMGRSAVASPYLTHL